MRIPHSVATLVLAAAFHAQADSLDEILKLVPPQAQGFLAVPDLETLSGDIDACIAGMDRKESVLAGRPIDWVRGALEIREGLNEKGSLALWWVKGDEGAAQALVVLIPTEDPAAFVKANIQPKDDGRGAMGGRNVSSRLLERHVLVSESKSTIDSYDPQGGIAEAITATVGERGFVMARTADAVAWAGSASIGAWREQSRRSVGDALGAVPMIPDAGSLGDGVNSILVAIDADPLGLSIRSLASFESGTDLAKLADGALPATSDGGVALGGLPANPYYMALGIDALAMGGSTKISQLASLLGAGDQLPVWLLPGVEGIKRVQFACYPSKLGVLVGGVLNDCALVITSDDPQALRETIKSGLLAQGGDVDGIRRVPGWEDDRKLKDGTLADAFEVKESPLGPSEAQGADLAQAAMQLMVRKAIFGSKGMNGFVKVLPGAVVITFSQRPDVLARALAAVGAERSLRDDAVIKSMRPWLIDGAQLEAFVSVGQILKLVGGLAEAFGGGGGAIPSLSTKAPPIAVAFRLDKGAAEAAVMIPTPVLAVIAEQMAGSVMGTPRREGAKPAPSGQRGDGPDPSDADTDGR